MLLLIFLVSLLLLLLYFWNTIKINVIVLLTVLRGILTPNCFWWRINDLLTDKTGSEIYRQMKDRGEKTVPINIAGTAVRLITDIGLTGEILADSPRTFGAGELKKQFFQPFMPKNVGISNWGEWSKRRHYNEKLLGTPPTGVKHCPARILGSKNPTEDSKNILFTPDVPRNFKQFSHRGKRITFKIVFGKEGSEKDISQIFDLLADANSLNVLWGVNPLGRDRVHQFRQLVFSHLGKEYLDLLVNKEEIISQIPHFLFPLAGLYAVALPRMLLILGNHPHILEKLQNGASDYYWRSLFLELFRLNNPVNSTFRTVNRDAKLDGVHFRKGDQLVIFNNPVMRDPQLFKEPDEFIPERWNERMEWDIRFLSFNTGPQRCPGKELSLLLLTSALREYLKRVNYRVEPNRTLDTRYIDQAINPCTVVINS